MTLDLFTILAVALFWESPAFGYIDPGSGSVLIQLLLGGIGGLFVVVKLYWRQFADFFPWSRSKKKDSAA